MQAYFRFSIVYLLLGLVMARLFAPPRPDMLLDGVAATLAFVLILGKVLLWLLPLFVAVALVTPWEQMRARLPLAARVAVGTVILQVGFSLVKSTIPYIMPFWADPLLARVGHWLHGTDTWMIAHALLPSVNGGLLPVIYLYAWSVLAMAFPVFLALFDDNARRQTAMITLYLFCWIGLGNVLAMVMSSVGPVFYDETYGVPRFSGLIAALHQSGVMVSTIGQTQKYLWDAYVSGNMAFGSGISAFPSVHVGMATLVAIYAGERWPLSIPVGVSFVATILLLSVWTGYHYAVDGYASVVLMLVAWLALRRLRYFARGPEGGPSRVPSGSA